VGVTLFQTRYADVPLWLVVFGAVFVSVMLISVYSLAEGTRLRLENRRLRRELRQVETEVNFLRTRPVGARVEPDEIGPGAPPRSGVAPPVHAAAPASAPVYDGADERSPESDDEDIYSGGRAV
jgi:hypothetical protein